MCAAIRFAHLSDWHATTPVGGGRALLHPKRISGWASWALSRRRRHSARVLEATIRDVRDQDVDRILVTGDLTHVSLEHEFRLAAAQLESLGSPEDVFLVPGNHDRYVPVEPERSWDLWSDYLRGAEPPELDAAFEACLAKAPADRRAPRHADFPTLRTVGRVALIGLCSAIPTPIFRAGGSLGPVQLERLEGLLNATRERGYCRVVLIHHPVAEKGEPTRRALWDAAELRGVLERAGAELVLHGHKHRRRVAMLTGPDGPIPSIGVRSSSEVGSRPEKLAQYHLYTVTPRGAGDGPAGFEITAEIRGFDPATGAYRPVDERLI